MSIRPPKFFSDHMAARILSNLEEWKEKERLHDPLAWRKAIPELASLDYKQARPDQRSTLSIRDLMGAFKFFGSISLDLRDVSGLGHGRVFLASKNRINSDSSSTKYQAGEVSLQFV